MNPDFDQGCKAVVNEVRRLRLRHTRTNDPYDWICYPEVRNEKTRLVQRHYPEPIGAVHLASRRMGKESQRSI